MYTCLTFPVIFIRGKTSLKKIKTVVHRSPYGEPNYRTENMGLFIGTLQSQIDVIFRAISQNIFKNSGNWNINKDGLLVISDMNV